MPHDNELPTVTVSLKDYELSRALIARAQELLAHAKDIVGECEKNPDELSFGLIATKNQLKAAIQSFEYVWRQTNNL